MIDVYRQGVPGNGNPFPKTLRFVKLACSSKRTPESSYFVMVADTLGHFTNKMVVVTGAVRAESITPPAVRILSSMSPIVQVFGCRHDDAIHALRRPASEKRQGTKSREVGHRRCRGRYGDLAAVRDLSAA